MTADTNAIKRYIATVLYDGSIEFYDAPNNGNWVRFSDCEAAIKKAREDAFEQTIKRLEEMGAASAAMEIRALKVKP